MNTTHKSQAIICRMQKHWLMNTFSKCVLALRRSMTCSFEIISRFDAVVGNSCWIANFNSIFSASNSNFQTKVNQMSCKILVKISPHETRNTHSVFGIYISHALYAFSETILVSMYAFLWSENFTAYHMFQGGGPTELKIKQNISKSVPGN